jgi:hypothetical protein
MKIDAQQIANFIVKWLSVGIVLHFGMKLGTILDGMLTFI